MLLNHFFDEFNNLYFANKLIQTIILIIQEALKSKCLIWQTIAPTTKPISSSCSKIKPITKKTKRMPCLALGVILDIQIQINLPSTILKVYISRKYLLHKCRNLEQEAQKDVNLQSILKLDLFY